MRYILILWAIPIVLFWGWFGLSAYDIDLGSVFLSRSFHDHMMNLYGTTLGIEASAVPGVIAGVFVLDTAIILAVAALRWHKKWLPQVVSFISDIWHRPKVYREFKIENTPGMYFEAEEPIDPEIQDFKSVEELIVGQAQPVK